ncbi:MAG: permease, partial [Acidobacteria bacterium]|nr:permease [Acidobacteriota bacterium]
MFERNALLAVYHDSGGIEEAVRELRKSGFDMKKVSIAGRDHHPEDGVAGYYLSGGRIRYWGKLDTFWSNIWGVLSGWAFFAIPGAGPVLVAGPLAGWIIAALEDAAVVGGLGIVGAALYSIGLPKE